MCRSVLEAARGAEHDVLRGPATGVPAPVAGGIREGAAGGPRARPQRARGLQRPDAAPDRRAPPPRTRSLHGARGVQVHAECFLAILEARDLC